MNQAIYSIRLQRFCCNPERLWIAELFDIDYKIMVSDNTQRGIQNAYRGIDTQV